MSGFDMHLHAGVLHICAHAHTHTQKRMYMHAHVHANTCMHTHMYTGTHVCAHTHVYVYTCTHMLEYIVHPYNFSSCALSPSSAFSAREEEEAAPGREEEFGLRKQEVGAGACLPFSGTKQEVAGLKIPDG